MMRLRLSEVAGIVGGRLSGEDVWLAGVSTDTRTVAGGELLVALRGPRFDAHECIHAGLPVTGLLVERRLDLPLPQVLVDDSRLALGRLAAAWRQICPARVLGLTGSNGKTTTKQMLASICQRRGRTLATQGNLNNDVGVPLTLLRLDPQDAFAVIEMGANHPGEIARLTQWVRPDVALITNAGPAHLEGFLSIEGVSRAKGEIFQGLGTAGVAVINADDTYADYWRGLNQGRGIVEFSMKTAQAQVRGEDADGRLRIIIDQEACEVSLPVAGEHNRMNALAAAASAFAIGIDLAAIREGLEGMTPMYGRLKQCRSASGLSLIDDTYNANPASTCAAIDVLAAAGGHRVLVLGDMAELGEAGPQLHARVGSHAASRGIDELFAVGQLTPHAVEAFGPRGRHFSDRAQLVSALKEMPHSGVTLLVKGSRTQRMEEIVVAMLDGNTASGESRGQQGGAHASHPV